MGMWGYLHRVAAIRLSQLLSDPPQIESELYPNEDDEQRLPECTVEKTWNAIEFILDRLAEAERIPWIGPLTEGNKTGIQFHYGDCWFRTPEEVREIANILSKLSKDDFKDGYIPEVMAKYNVYPDIWHRPEREENFEYIWAWYKPMVEFYCEAASKGDGLLLHLG